MQQLENRYQNHIFKFFKTKNLYPNFKNTGKIAFNLPSWFKTDSNMSAAAAEPEPWFSNDFLVF